MPAFAWSPSAARTVVLADQALPAPPGRVATVLPLRWPEKPAGARLDYVLDASGLLSGSGDVLSATVNATTNVQAVAAPVIIAGLIIVWLAGGAAGGDGLVDMSIVAASGASVRRILRVAIV